MSLVMVGIHERDAPLDLVGEVSISDHDLSKVLATLGDSSNVDEVVVLSTCMRTEVYAVVERFHEGIATIHEFFSDRAGRSDPRLVAEYLRVDYDDAAARHLFEVAAGIDSAVLGEGEILRQVRQASSRAQREGASGPLLDRLFRHALETGKRVRSETAIARGITSLAHVAVEVARRGVGGTLAGRNAVVVGAGEMGEGIVAALRSFGDTPSALAVVNRSLPRAERLAARFDARVGSLPELSRELVAADVVITATSGEQPVLELTDVQAAMAARKGRELVIVDGAMPPDVDPSARMVPGVSLFDLDDLRRFAEAEMASRREEIGRVAEIVDDELERYRTQVRTRSVAPVITALRRRADHLVDEELEVFRSRLAQLPAEERDLVETLTHRLVQKILHEPTVQLKEAAGSGRGERLAEAVRTLFNL